MKQRVKERMVWSGLLIASLIFIAIMLSGCGSGMPSTRAAEPGDHVVEGDSIPALCSNFTQGLNRAIPGSTSTDLLARMRIYVPLDEGASYHILIGINDIVKDEEGLFYGNMNNIFLLLEGQSVTVTSILPTLSSSMNERVLILNDQLAALVESHGFIYDDRYEDMANIEEADNTLRLEYALDLIHLNADGCAALFYVQLSWAVANPALV